MDRDDVRHWVAGYERAWRTAGTEALDDLFSPDATYRMSPWSTPVSGLAGIRQLWETEREGPDEQFTMSSDVVAVDGRVAVVRVEVAYRQERWRDLWVLLFGDDGRCRAFEEWPFAPEQPDGR